MLWMFVTSTHGVKPTLESFVSYQAVNTAPPEIIVTLIAVCHRSPIYFLCACIDPALDRKAQWDTFRADMSIFVEFGRPILVKLSRSIIHCDVANGAVVDVYADSRDVFSGRSRCGILFPMLIEGGLAGQCYTGPTTPKQRAKPEYRREA